MSDTRATPLSDKERQILFVLGAARSGTTFLNGFLFRWFDIGTGPEGQFVEYFANRLRRYGDLRNTGNMRALIRNVSQCEMLDIIRNRWPADMQFDVTPEWIESELPDRTYAGLVFALFRCVALGQGKSRVGNKYPGYWRHLDLLDSLFSTNAKYLGIVRDGRDVAMSTMRTPWGERNAYACAKEWVRCVEAMRRFQTSVGPSRFLILRYEDLLQEQVPTLDKLADFLESDLSLDQVEGAMAEMMDSASRHAVDKWKTEMTAEDRRRFEALAGNTLAEFGYDVASPTLKVTAPEACYLIAGEYFNKARRNIVNGWSSAMERIKT